MTITGLVPSGRSIRHTVSPPAFLQELSSRGFTDRVTDFTHCLVDSFENITHSLCTTEFELSRESYNWLVDKLDVFKPMQREYGRLNLTGTVLSKRKLNALVTGCYVRGWDDPRLYTLIALRRRGIPPGAILSFVNELGVTKNVTNIEINRFEQTLRSYLEFSVPRLMMVLDPIEVVIDDLPDDHLEMIEQPFAPKDPAFGVSPIFSSLKDKV